MFFTSTGVLCETVENKSKGGQRKATLRDAKKEGWFPSVTKIIDQLDKPALTTWKINKALETLIKLGIDKTKDSKVLIESVNEEMYSDMDATKQLGIDIHNAVEEYLKGFTSDTWTKEQVNAINHVKQTLEDNKLTVVAVEKKFTNKSFGYGGIIDLVCEDQHGDTVIIDLKTKNTTPGKKIFKSDENAMQLAAYGRSIKPSGDFRAYNLYISVTEPGRIDFSEIKNIGKQWNVFKCLLELWIVKNDYDPRK